MRGAPEDPRRRRARFGPRRARAGLGLAAAAVLAVLAGAAQAEPTTLALDPETTTIRFQVPATLHTVRGTLRLVRGVVHFDTGGGEASGAVVVDATSADTGNDRRDRNLHADVLESEAYPRMVFRPERVRVEGISGSEADVRVFGHLRIHGDEHALDFPAQVRADGARVEISASFEVPYVAWGMEDPSNFLLSVGEVVSVEVEAVGRLDPPPEPGGG